ncbi:hypothetical protein Sinac_2180 [Singulisphaera acidiphila DSM 18658]|uniref:Uncharacterized protein n=1 Tax=Singulisphaera acidiphila (strain ATCC BAA-1392 / DSM 18658 / VKM B-2454 / MOB10) TaxID=886293 RepID=L0DCB2_SINAD|nr:hypothetical protein Sinac_2180 [Singulisphaera acidiphila DSM 18658]
MTLSRIVASFAASPVDIAAVPLQLLAQAVVLLRQLLIGPAGGLIECGEQVLDPLLPRVAGRGRIAGDWRRRGAGLGISTERINH